jgi:septal ring factor EnvC (AmiA/AmiB activator)
VSRGIWKRLFGEKPPEDWTETFETLERRIRRLEEEWTDVYHKFRQLHMRVAKQVQRLDQAPETETTQREEGDSPENGQSLSERQRKLQEQILARRNRSGLLHG